MRKIYIVPDVHGRSFYESPVKKALSESESEIIFLGDYIDPYPHEKIDPYDSLQRFMSIIELKKKYPDKITLLIGNHDLHYFDGSRRGCRMDYEHARLINDLFVSNMNLFDYAKFVTIGGKNIIFSHAGFHYNWFREYADKLGVCDESWDDFNEENCISKFCFDFLAGFDWTEMALSKEWLKRYGDCGYSRGGWCGHPSFLWADLSDHLFDHVRVKDCEQVFGHTMQVVGNPVRFDNCYCLDCQNVFVLDGDGNIKNLDGIEIAENGSEIEKVYNEYYKQIAMFI